jgi:hypothetical protein
MSSNLAKGAILFGTIYITVFLFSFAMLSFRTSLSITSPATANAINTALPAPTSTSSGNDLLLLVMELAIISAVAILEMKAKILTKLHRYLKGIFKKMHPLLIKTLWAAVIICCALLVLFY